jgi:23S rRNA (uracil1939-C5)-methyltransferase
MGKAQVVPPPASFLQATDAGEKTLGALVCEAITGARRVADLFCGIGPFALRLARTCAVAAFDSNAPAIAALKAATSRTQGLKPITAAERDLFRRPLTANELNGFEALGFDPPRAGAEAQARQIAASRVARVVAVSCDPGTFARDAKLLVAGGYRLERVTPVDQFRHSAHLELVAVFSR